MNILSQRWKLQITSDIAGEKAGDTTREAMQGYQQTRKHNHFTVDKGLDKTVAK